MNLRQERERWEDGHLAPSAAHSARSLGRPVSEEECSLRPAFQRDRDRILYAKAFRRLKHKTQVFLAPTGDHYRTRLTHTLEVAQIGRTMARALELNEDLVEAIALGHDLGHTPFGHAGEAVLNKLLPGGFRHHQQSLRVVDRLEKDGRGLNLTHEVRMGILYHSKGKGSFLPSREHPQDLTLEAHLVRAADLMAYLAHDCEDAVRGGVIKRGDLPPDVTRVLGSKLSRQIDTTVRSLISETQKAGLATLALAPEVNQAIWQMRDFLWRSVYENIEVHGDFIKAEKMLTEIFGELMRNDAFFAQQLRADPPGKGRERQVADYIAGMSDRYALQIYETHFLPRPWGRF